MKNKAKVLDFFECLKEFEDMQAECSNKLKDVTERICKEYGAVKTKYDWEFKDKQKEKQAMDLLEYEYNKIDKDYPYYIDEVEMEAGVKSFVNFVKQKYKKEQK